MFKKNIIYLAFFMALIGTFALGCGGQKLEQKAAQQEGLQVVTSTSILADIVENILGNQGTVSYLVPIGDSPEEYEPLPSDMQKASNADVLFLNGLSLEKGVERSMTNIIDNIVFVSDGIDPIPLVGEDTPDPHAWLNVQLVADFYVENILTTLIKLDPTGADEYRQNATAYVANLKDLDTWIMDQVKQIPENNRIIVVSENALKYFGEAYGFQTEGIWELNSHEEGTPQQISRVVDLVIERSLPAVFVESTVDKRYMEIISNETGAPIAEELYTDALGLLGSNTDTYIKMMKHNTNVFVKGLSQ